jgi:hypothetical protein
MDPTLFQTLAGAGPIGVLAIVIWILMRREERDRLDRIEKERLDRDAVKAEAESRVTLATALTALSLQIEQWTK